MTENYNQGDNRLKHNASDYRGSYGIMKRPVPLSQALWAFIHIMLVDVVVYGILLPLAGAYLGGNCARLFYVGHKIELIMIVAITFGLMYGTMYFIGEALYWKHLFVFDPFYQHLLQMRDIFNSILIFICLLTLASTIEVMIVGDKEMKLQYTSEGVGYFTSKTICDLLHIDSSFLNKLGIHPPHRGDQFEHGAMYMFYWGLLSACVAKLVYFNTLFSYLTAMEIFISMKPTFEGTDFDDESSNDINGHRSIYSRLENDFADSIRDLIMSGANNNK